LLSVANLSQLPADNGAEVAFAGRSNSGKSSTLNAITAQGKLARTSRTPGRTQLINYFGLEDDRYLVDLPGFGYAKVSHTVRDDWHQLLDSYLSNRESLRGLVLVTDIRHAPTDFDCDLMKWTGEIGLPLLLLLNKADKFNRGPALQIIAKVKAEIANQSWTHVSVQLFSALRKQGIDEARLWLDERLYP